MGIKGYAFIRTEVSAKLVHESRKDSRLVSCRELQTLKAKDKCCNNAIVVIKARCKSIKRRYYLNSLSYVRIICYRKLDTCYVNS